MKKISKLLAIFLILLILQFVVPVMQFMQNTTKAVNREITIVLDPGHGGKMTGAINNEKGLIERDLNLKITRYLRDYLNEYENVKVIMTHNGLPSDGDLELPDRGMVARNNKADVMFSLHLNSSTNQNSNGAEVFVTNNKLLPKYNQESTKIGNMILNQLSSLGIKNNGVKTRLCNDVGPKWEYSDGSRADYYAVIRYPMKGNGEDRGANLAAGEGIPGILIEHCYIVGQDAKFLDSELDIQKLARADCNAIVQYYGLQKRDPSRVSTVTLDKTNLTLVVGDKANLVATVLPSTAKNKQVTWSTSNNKVVEVSQTGEIAAVGVGTATVTVTTKDRAKTATATINVKDITLTLDKKETNLIIGNKTKIEYEILPSIVKNKQVTWISSNPEIALVDANGIITAVKEGTATITATTKQGNKQASVKVNTHELKQGQKIKINNLKDTNGNLSKIGEKVTLASLKKNFELSADLEIIAKNNKNIVLKDSDIVGTGTKVEIIEKATNKVLQEYECIIYGDVNGDGKISAMDYTLIENHIMEIEFIQNAKQKLAADVYSDNKISAMDYTYIENHIMEIELILLR